MHQFASTIIHLIHRSFLINVSLLLNCANAVKFLKGCQHLSAVSTKNPSYRRPDKTITSLDSLETGRIDTSATVHLSSMTLFCFIRVSICAGQVLRCIVRSAFELSVILRISIPSVHVSSSSFRLGGSRVSVTTV